MKDIRQLRREYESEYMLHVNPPSFETWLARRKFEMSNAPTLEEIFKKMRDLAAQHGMRIEDIGG